VSNWKFFNEEWNVRQEKNREQIRLSGVNISGMAEGSSSTHTTQKQEKIYSQEKTHKKLGGVK
jgi:allophanate hydrolase subunit 2